MQSPWPRVLSLSATDVEARGLLHQRLAVRVATRIGWLHDGRHDPLAFVALEQEAWRLVALRQGAAGARA